MDPQPILQDKSHVYKKIANTKWGEDGCRQDRNRKANRVVSLVECIQSLDHLSRYLGTIDHSTGIIFPEAIQAITYT